MPDEIRSLSDAEVLREVRWRFRICSYLFKLGAAWIALGALGVVLTGKNADESPMLALIVQIVGAGIFTAAFALTLAIYRCPRCDKYLSRFRPDKTKCPRCGATVREGKQ